MQKLKSLFFLLMGLSLMPLLGGCHLAMFEGSGSIASEQARLIIIAAILMMLIVVPVIFMTFIIAWRYRASNKKAKYDPDWSHSVILEILCWGIPCIIILVLAVLAWITSHTLDPYRSIKSSVKPLTVQAIALDWKWVFIYPEQGIATINYIEIPKDTPISFEITSQGPMNSLWIPQLGGQIYAMAGMRTRLHLVATQEGIFNGGSANYSGEGFAEMTFKVKSDSPEEFNAWVNEVKTASETLTYSKFNALIAPTKAVPVTYFSQVDENIFDNEMMKFMMPMPNLNKNSSTIE